MTVLHYTQEIARPVADVFDVVIHAGDFASWNPTIKSSRQLSPDPIGDGATFSTNASDPELPDAAVPLARSS
jgi:hypothetical protein